MCGVCVSIGSCGELCDELWGVVGSCGELWRSCGELWGLL